LPWQRPLGDRKTTNPENLAKIGPADFEIIGLAKPLKINIKIRNSSRTYYRAAAGRGKECQSLPWFRTMRVCCDVESDRLKDEVAADPRAHRGGVCIDSVLG